MNEKEILSNLKSAYEKITPNDIDGVMKKIRNIEKESEVMKNNKNKNWLKWALVPTFVILIFCAFLGIQNTKNSGISIVSIDVNPSIEIEVNKDEKIIKARAINNDAKKILEDIDLKNVDLNTGIHAIMGSMLKNGYIDELKNSILVTVQNDNATSGLQLQIKLETQINEILESYKINASIMSQTLNETKTLQSDADTYQISAGKVKLINEIIKKNPLYTFEQLASLDIQELNLIANTTNQEIGNIKVTGNASEKAYIGRDEAFAKALAHANIDKSQAQLVKIEFDYDDGIMEYEVEFYVNNIEYEYEINATTGDIIKVSRDNDDNIIINDNTNTNTNTNNTQNSNRIGETAALNRALSHAGVNQSNTYDVKSEFDYEDGRAAYEVEFDTREYEYKYYIDATNGSVIHFEKEFND